MAFRQEGCQPCLNASCLNAYIYIYAMLDNTMLFIFYFFYFLGCLYSE